MGSAQAIPWYNVPAREFPVTRWLRQRYGFSLPPLVLARSARRASAAAPEQRRFPALVWLEQRQQRAREPGLAAGAAPQAVETAPKSASHALERGTGLCLRRQATPAAACLGWASARSLPSVARAAAPPCWRDTAPKDAAALQALLSEMCITAAAAI